jgi:hypothetical protein
VAREPESPPKEKLEASQSRTEIYREIPRVDPDYKRTIWIDTVPSIPLLREPPGYPGADAQCPHYLDPEIEGHGEATEYPQLSP